METGRRDDKAMSKPMDVRSRPSTFRLYRRFAANLPIFFFPFDRLSLTLIQSSTKTIKRGIIFRLGRDRSITIASSFRWLESRLGLKIRLQLLLLLLHQVRKVVPNGTYLRSSTNFPFFSILGRIPLKTIKHSDSGAIDLSRLVSMTRVEILLCLLFFINSSLKLVSLSFENSIKTLRFLPLELLLLYYYIKFAKLFQTALIHDLRRIFHFLLSLDGFFLIPSSTKTIKHSDSIIQIGSSFRWLES